MKSLAPILLACATLVFALKASAQLNITSAQQSGNWASYYVEEVLLGSGVEAFNATFTTDSAQIGEFTSNNTSINMAYGLILGTGDVLDAPGPNTSGSTSSGLGVPGDNDLFLLGGNTSFDAAILEFDFVPAGDTVRFNYIFASEEYNEFVNAGVNDAFGFFLSGPGISGGQGYANDAVNIALIPGTNTGVSINTVNLGSNSAYYINNDQLNSGTLEYDGLTVKLQASYPVNCTDTYHIKLAIGDGGDGVWDSGVFLEGGSFGSNLIEVNIATVNGDSTINEGCGEAAINFNRSDTSDTSVTFIQYSGTATNGVDFDTLPDTIILVPGVFDTTIVISPYFDGLNEGVEFITISAITITSCNDTFTSTGTMYIYDVPDFGLVTTPDTAFDCPVNSLDISSVAQGGGPPPFTYTWNTGQTGDSITVNLSPGAGVDTFAVEVWDSCGLFSNVDTVLVFKNYSPGPWPTIINDTTVKCKGDLLTLDVIDSLGVAPFSYQWSNGDTTKSSDFTVDSFMIVSITVTDLCGVTGTDTAAVSVQKVKDFKIVAPDSIEYCKGAWLYIKTYATSGANPYEYSWDLSNPIFNDSSNQRFQIDNDTILKVWARDVCGRVTDKDISIAAFEVDTLNVFAPDVNPDCPNDAVRVLAIADGGLRPYSYLWSTGDTSSSFIAGSDVSVRYFVTVYDACQNIDTAATTLLITEFGDLRISVSGGTKVCYGDEYIVELLGYGGAGDYDFDWTWKIPNLIGEEFLEIDNGLYSITSQQTNVHYFTITDQCGNSITDSVSIEVDHCLSVPNVITPNGDGENDIFVINNIEAFPDSRITVYNRWGNKVLDQVGYQNDWYPKDEPSGTYYYVITSDEFPQMRGDLTIFSER